jgi:hypothetical protein
LVKKEADARPRKRRRKGLTSRTEENARTAGDGGFFENGGGLGAVYVADSVNVNIDGNTICKSGIGLYVRQYCTATVKNNIFFKNNKSGGSMYGIAKYEYTGTLNILNDDFDLTESSPYRGTGGGGTDMGARPYATSIVPTSFGSVKALFN